MIADLIASFALSAFLTNMIVGLFFREYDFRELILLPGVWNSMVAAAFFFITRYFNSKYLRAFHFITVLLVAFLAIWDEYDSFYGLGFTIIGAVIGFKYGYFDKGIKWKIPLWLVSTIVLIECSAIFGVSEDNAASIGVVVFLVFFVGFFFFMYKEDIDRLSSVNKGLAADLIKTRRESIRLERAVRANDQELDGFREAAHIADISIEEKWETLKIEFRLTGKELSVIKQVYDTGDMNADIASTMGVTEGTIKKHLNKILQKMDTRDRLDLVVVTKNYLSY